MHIDARKSVANAALISARSEFGREVLARVAFEKLRQGAAGGFVVHGCSFLS